MCGICGFVNLDGQPIERGVLERMSRALAHRGPDGAGLHIGGPVGLAARRLAIMDVAGGDQPIANEDQTAWVVFNGEIYNSPDLMNDLQGRGHRFLTHCDTESIVHQYEESGPACTDHLRGMFAFAVSDERAAGASGPPRLLLARDRLGVKPLFYYHDNGLLAFSSELTSLLQHPGIPRAIEPSALYQYLAAGAVAAPSTMFRGVRQLLPGQRLVLDGRSLKVETYWQPPRAMLPPLLSEQEAVDELRQLLEVAVREHMLADVPIGALLSGGIDSSTVVALMARAGGRRVATFSIRFEAGGAYDESAYSRLVSQRYDTEHHEYTVRSQGFDYNLLEAMITHHGQPVADTSAIPTFIVSRLAREHVKVVLSGDGGDECFAGYHHFAWVPLIERLYACPESLRRLAGFGLRKLAVVPGLDQQEWLRRASNAVDASLSDPVLLPLEVLRINSDPEILELLAPDWRPDDIGASDDLRAFLRNNAQGDPIARGQRFAMRYFLPDAYLAKVDRMSMANALEVRVPLLDHRLVEFALTLPGGMHYRNGVGKYLLRKAVSDLLPDEVLSHRKQGFSIPLHQWTTDAYFDLARELLGEAAVRRRGLFEPKPVQQLIDRCQGRSAQSRSLESEYRLHHRVFMLVALELWNRLYIDKVIEQPTETSRWAAAEVEHSCG